MYVCMHAYKYAYIHHTNTALKSTAVDQIREGQVLLTSAEEVESCTIKASNTVSKRYDSSPPPPRAGEAEVRLT